MIHAAGSIYIGHYRQQNPLDGYPGRTSPNTLKLLAEADDYFIVPTLCDDLPYYDTQHEKPWLMVRYIFQIPMICALLHPGFHRVSILLST